MPKIQKISAKKRKIVFLLQQKSAMLSTIAHNAPISPTSPIGVFDSGVGGLSVFMHLAKLLPFENYMYLADTLNVPYGSRPEQEIETLTLQAVAWLKSQGCKIIVIACNTASAYGLDKARQVHPDLDIVGLVPALKPAVNNTQTGQVAVLATPATLNGRLLNEVIDTIATPKNVTVHKHSIISLVPWVEAGMPSEHIAVNELAKLWHTLGEHSIDQLVLGCTHYPFFKHYLTDIFQKSHPLAHLPQGLAVIDSGRAIANRVQSLLDKQHLLNPSQSPAVLQFFSTANPDGTRKVARRLIQQFEPDWQINFYQATI